MPPRQGGHQQERKRRAETEFPEESGPASSGDKFSPLGWSLLEKWAWGVISSILLQELAAAAKATFGRGTPDIDKFASLGAHGSLPNHINRDLRVHLKDVITPEAYVFQVPFSVKKGTVTQVVWLPCSILLPHEWFALLAKDHPAILRLDRIKEFWSKHLAHDPKLIGNPILSVDEFRDIFLPLLVHGDGVEFQTRDSLMVISMRSILTEIGGTATSQLLLAAIPKTCRVIAKKRSGGLDTMHEIWKALAWSFACLFHGKHPLQNHLSLPFEAGSKRFALAGKPLAAGFRAVIWVAAGDNDYFSNELGLPHHGAKMPCPRCACTSGIVMPYNDFRDQAGWKTSMIRPPASRALPAFSNHPIHGIPGVVRETFEFDSLHTLEYGPAQHFVANVFFEMVYEELPGTRDEAVQTLYSNVLGEYKAQRIDCSNHMRRLKLETFCDPSRPHQEFPELGTGIKARHVRYLVPVVRALCQKAGIDTAAKKHRLAAAEHLESLYHIVDGNDLFVPPVEAASFAEHMDKFLLHYTWLAKHAFEDNKYKWSVVPKFHYCAHLPDQIAFLNLRVTWCYGGETMAGIVSALGHSCLSGTPPEDVPCSMIGKYRVAVDLRLKYDY